MESFGYVNSISNPVSKQPLDIPYLVATSAFFATLSTSVITACFPVRVAISQQFPWCRASVLVANCYLAPQLRLLSKGWFPCHGIPNPLLASCWAIVSAKSTRSNYEVATSSFAPLSTSVVWLFRFLLVVGANCKC